MPRAYARRNNPTPKIQQLRVRLTDVERQALDAALLTRGPDATLSDLIRELLQPIITPGGHCYVLALSSPAAIRLEGMAQTLRRNPAQIVECCINDIHSTAYREDGENYQPLTVREIRLRKQYQPQPLPLQKAA
ncbi:hypothetical protein DB346_08590 [Verrucomicrobia bacterium LW23]|nr:hypothetical protein DB346_08590 [Verrucomicrobia bacterium LW23]